MNNSRNGVILLVFQTYKIRSMHFAGNLIPSTSCEFYDDDVTVTSFINIKYGNVAVKVFPCMRRHPQGCWQMEQNVWTNLDGMLKNKTVMFNI